MCGHAGRQQARALKELDRTHFIWWMAQAYVPSARILCPLHEPCGSGAMGQNERKESL